jgi:hypothetical protein
MHMCFLPLPHVFSVLMYHMFPAHCALFVFLFPCSTFFQTFNLFAIVECVFIFVHVTCICNINWLKEAYSLLFVLITSPSLLNCTRAHPFQSANSKFSHICTRAQSLPFPPIHSITFHIYMHGYIYTCMPPSF